MQRSKIQVGVEYAESRVKDWAEYPSYVTRVQVLDAEPWLVQAHWQATHDESDPDTVPDPGSPEAPHLIVPKRYRRRDKSRGYRDKGNLVLIRSWIKPQDHVPGHWGDPEVTETRMLVTTWEDAEDKMQAVRDRKSEERKAANAEKARLREREGRINERVRDLGILTSFRVERSRMSRDTDVLTIKADTLEALLGLAEVGRAAQDMLADEYEARS